MEIRQILEDVKRNKIDIDDAISLLKGFDDIHYAKVDLRREENQGYPEVIYGASKTIDQILGIMRRLQKHENNIIVTRISPEVSEEIIRDFPLAEYFSEARLLFLGEKPELSETKIAVVSAGTSDMNVSEEAAITAELLGNRVERFYDVGVAGIHRLLNYRESIREARVVIVVAGMEGALLSVVGGMCEKPVIGVPTSVGYGANFQGVAALLSMLNSCASGVSVVNIDNGFGAGYLASVINRL